MLSNRSADSTAVPRRVCLLVSSIARAGGAERVVSILANAWTRSGAAVSIVTTDSPRLPPFYELDPAVEVRNLDVSGVSHNPLQAIARNVRQLARIRRAVRNLSPDVVISFIDVLNVSAVFALLGSGVPVIAAERTAPAHAPIGRAWTFLRNVAYRMSDRVVVQSAGAAEFFQRILGKTPAVVPNPVPIPEVSEMKTAGSRIVAIGRFTAEKAFDDLIRAFAIVAGRFPGWTLTIYGDGPLRPDLERVVAEESLSGRVFLPGVTNDSAGVLAGADVFALSSRFEGFPNALCEAMAAGVACIATDCPDGPREIVSPDLDGILVPAGDRDAFAAALARLMASADERQRLGANARGRITRFSVERVVNRWNALIGDVVAQRKAR